MQLGADEGCCCCSAGVTHGFELLVFHGELGVELVVDVVNAARVTLHVEVALLQRRDALLLVLALSDRLQRSTSACVDGVN